MNDAMIKTLEKIDAIGSQTSQKIEDVRTESTLNSLDKDDMTDIKTKIQKLIVNNDIQFQKNTKQDKDIAMYKK